MHKNLPMDVSAMQFEPPRAPGNWKIILELAEGAAAWVREIRTADTQRFTGLERGRATPKSVKNTNL
jgi:hypothetical protein